MAVEDQLRRTIIRKYGSINKFALLNNIPSSTVYTMLRRGLDNTNFRTIKRVCKALRVSIDSLAEDTVIVLPIR